MNFRGASDLEADAISKKLRAVRLIQDLCLKEHDYWQLPEILLMILRSLEDRLGFKHSMIYLLNDDGQTMSFQSGWGYTEGHIGPPVKVGYGLIGIAAQSGEVMRVGDLGKGFRYLKAIRTRTEASSVPNGERPAPLPGIASPESLMSVPLKYKSEVIGVIVVESKQAGAFDEIDQELLLLIAGQTARLIEEVRRTNADRRRQEDLLHAKNKLDQLNAFLDAVLSASTMEHTPKYAAALAKQVKGLRCAPFQKELACTYFEQAADIFQEIGMGLEMARSKLGAALLTLQESPDDADQMLQECLNGFEACGAHGFAKLTSELLKRLRSKDSGFYQLTKRERQVAAVAAKGLSNEEIAKQLSISVRTVTTHLERIYSKLEIGSRASLMQYFDQIL